jgi:large subunit ribosomal protein L10
LRLQRARNYALKNLAAALERSNKDSNMAVTKAKKIEQVEALTKEFQDAKHGIVGTFAKMTVEKDFELRKAVRSAGGKYRVLKNTLAERAAKGSAVEEAVKSLAGVTSIAYTSGDPVALAKALSKYAKDNPEYTFKAGIVEGRVIAIKDIDALANMPSKEEIYSKLLFLMTAPAQRLVTVMNAVGRDLAVVINQGVEKNKFGGAAEATPEAPAPEAAPAEAAPAEAQA